MASENTIDDDRYRERIEKIISEDRDFLTRIGQIGHKKLKS